MRGPGGFRVKNETEKFSRGLDIDLKVLEKQRRKGSWARGFFPKCYHALVFIGKSVATIRRPCKDFVKRFLE